MAKIQDLNVTTLKINNGAITEFFSPYSGTLGTNRYVDVTYDAYSQVGMIWVVSTAGNTNLYYNYGGVDQDLIQAIAGNICQVCGDQRPAGTVTYALQGSGTATITGAMVRYR